MELDEIMKIVNSTLDLLYKNEKYLFENDVSERNLVFHFSRYFCLLLEKNNKYKEYSVDCEYNRNSFNERKYKELIYEKKKHKINPDFILHERGSNNNNILAIEFKKNSNNNNSQINRDYWKLKGLTNELGVYKYKLGLFIRFGIRRDKVIIKAFINGKEKIRKMGEKQL
ncbi:MAG: hypothetical protein IJ220_01605 [Clostridia bacterium]|nr:hypothetical protein [Clostridia bacterium]